MSGLKPLKPAIIWPEKSFYLLFIVGIRHDIEEYRSARTFAWCVRTARPH